MVAKKPHHAGTRSIDQASSIPFYYQLQEILKEEIEQGRWKPGELVPSESQLREMYGVSRTVIRSALDVLEGDGQVVRIKGKGTVVSRPKFEYEMIGPSREPRVTANGQPARLARVIEARWITAGIPVAKLFGIDPLERVLRLDVLHSVAESAASLSQVFLRSDASPELAELATADEVPALEEGGPDVATQLAERHGVVVAESRLTIEATRSNDFEAELLSIEPGVPVFLVSTVDVSREGNPIALIRTIARSDQFHFSAVMRRTDGR